jgi:uncharacterized repeat protein (TIGR02543 family)
MREKKFKKASVFLVSAVFVLTVLSGAFLVPFSQNTEAVIARAAVVDRAPVIMNVTDAVQRGEQFSINGAFFEQSSLVRIAPSVLGLSTSAVFPASGTPHPQVVTLSRTQFDAAREGHVGGHYMVCQFPLTASAGMYDMWISNSIGVSEVVRINGPRAFFISEFEAWEGQFIDISGRNFDTTVFSAFPFVPTVRLSPVQGGENVYLTGKDIIEFNEFRIRFNIPDGDTLPYGEYNVGVGTIGVGTAGEFFAGLQEKQTLTILPASDDPYGVGAAWVRHINWSNRRSVDLIADNAAIQEAINTVGGTPGGGYVFFPNGSYSVSYLTIPNRVALIGESMDGVIFNFSGGYNSGRMIEQERDRSSIGYKGLANLTMRNPHDCAELCDPARAARSINQHQRLANVPDIYLTLGDYSDDSGRYQFHDRNSNEGYFLKNVRLDTPMSPSRDYSPRETVHRGYGIMMFGSRIVIDNADVKGFGGHIKLSGTEYVRIENTKSVYAAAQTNVLNSYAFVIRSEFQGRREFNSAEALGLRSNRQDYWISMHGIMARDKSHYDDVRISGMGAHRNDGEVIGIEVPNGYHGSGEVQSATATSVTLGGRMPFISYADREVHHTLADFYDPIPCTRETHSRNNCPNTCPTRQGDRVNNYRISTSFGRYSIMIIHGRGRGQIRPAIMPRGGTTKTIQLAPGYTWDIIPDSTSIVSMVTPNDFVTINNITADDCAKGIWMFGNCFDTVVANSTLHDTDGITYWAAGMEHGRGIVTNMFGSVRNNTVSGRSYATLNTEICVIVGRNATFGRNDGQFKGTMMMSIDIRNNRLIGNPSIPQTCVSCAMPSRPPCVGCVDGRDEAESSKQQAIVISAARFRSPGGQGGNRGDAGDITNVLVMNNEIRDARRGIVYTPNIDGFLAQNNTRCAATPDGTPYAGHTTDRMFHYTFHTQSGGAPLGERRIVNYDFLGPLSLPAIPFSVLFDSTGGSAIPYQVFERGQRATRPDNPELDGFAFGGWYADREFTDAWDFNTVPTESTILFARWAQVRYSLTLNTNGGSLTNAPETYNTGTMMPLPVPSRDGYRFLGWFTADGEGGEQRISLSESTTGDIVLYARWEARKGGCQSTVNNTGLGGLLTAGIGLGIGMVLYGVGSRKRGKKA